MVTPGDTSLPIAKPLACSTSSLLFIICRFLRALLSLLIVRVDVNWATSDM